MKISFSNEGEIKNTSAEGKPREFVTSWPIVKEWLKKILETEIKWEGRKDNRKSENLGKYIDSFLLSVLNDVWWQNKSYNTFWWSTQYI